MSFASIFSSNVQPCLHTIPSLSGLRCSPRTYSSARKPQSRAQRPGLQSILIYKKFDQKHNRTVRVTVASAAAGTEQNLPPRQALTPEQLAVWDASIKTLCDSVEGMQQETAEKTIERAFGWGPQAFWRGAKVREAVPEGQVEAVLQYLTSLGIQGADMGKVLKMFPEVLGCGVEEQLRESVGVLEGVWKLKGMVLTKALIRRPQVLGFNTDCEGSCKGDCNRCWVRF